MMPCDKKLLELAAKAAGYAVDFECEVNGYFANGYCEDGNVDEWWNPLTDDGDAMRLAVRLELNVNVERTTVDVYDRDARLSRVWAEEVSDPYDATRRAIVRAAAEIGKEMK